MTFYGIEIGEKPTLQQIEVYIAEKGFCIEPQDVYDHYEKMGWKTKKKTPLVSVEAMVNSYNGVHVMLQMKSKKRLEKATRFLEKAEEMSKGGVIDRECAKEDIKWSKKEILQAKNKLKEISKQNKKPKIFSPYSKQLKDNRWKAFRDFVFSVRGKKCEICGSTSILSVHHIEYKKGAKAWEYTVNDVMVVCSQCHSKLHGKC